MSSGAIFGQRRTSIRRWPSSKPQQLAGDAEEGAVSKGVPNQMIWRLEEILCHDARRQDSPNT